MQTVVKTVFNRAFDLLFIGGVSAFFFVGAFQYELGTLNEMGPGFLPAVFGAIGLILGGLVFLFEGEASSSGEGATAGWPMREAIFVALSILVFSLALEVLGLFVSTFLATVVCSAASSGTYPWRQTLIWALLLALLTCLIFVYALGLSMKLLPVLF
jgi:hypothetical protein